MSDNTNETPEFLPVVIEPLPADAPEWATMLNTHIGMLASGINQTNVNITSALSAINFIRNEVGPIVDSLSRNPMFKMLGVGK